MTLHTTRIVNCVYIARDWCVIQAGNKNYEKEFKMINIYLINWSSLISHSLVIYSWSGLDYRNGCTCEIHRQKPLARSRSWRLLRQIRSPKSRLRHRNRLHFKQPNSRHWFRYPTLVSRPMVIPHITLSFLAHTMQLTNLLLHQVNKLWWSNSTKFPKQLAKNPHIRCSVYPQETITLDRIWKIG